MRQEKENQMNFFCDLRFHAQNISSGKPNILWFARETLFFIPWIRYISVFIQTEMADVIYT